MKYKEWIGELEGMLPDVGQVSKGRVLLIDTDGKAEALKGHEKSLTNLTLEEGETRWQKQLKADVKATAKEEAASEPETPRASTATPPEPTTTSPAPVSTPESTTPKGGNK